MRLSTDQRQSTGMQTARSYGGADHRERREVIMRSREDLKQMTQTPSLSPRSSLVKRSATKLCVEGSITASCEIDKRKESEHD